MLLRLAGTTTVEEANRFLRERYIPEMNRKFGVQAEQPGHAFVPLHGQDLDQTFSVQTERVVAKDNTVQIGNRCWQIERTTWRGTAGGLPGDDLRASGRAGNDRLRAARRGAIPGSGGVAGRTASHPRGKLARAAFGANLSRPTGSFG